MCMLLLDSNGYVRLPAKVRKVADVLPVLCQLSDEHVDIGRISYSRVQWSVLMQGS